MPTPVPAAQAIPAAAAPAATSAPAAAAASAPALPLQFAGQVARPLLSLAAAAPGEHMLTISVTPENLGPVTVRAHVGAEGVRIELFAPTDLGRDALRTIMPDLRRDLAASGLGGSLDLSSHDQATHTGGDDAARARAAVTRLETATGASAADDDQRAPARIDSLASTIDVMA